jgi:hypothetical protein
MRIRKPTTRWFKVPGDPDAAEIKIKALAPGDRFKIYDAAFKQEIVYNGPGDGQPSFKQITDKETDRIETAKAVVVDWKNVFDLDDQPLDCTPENIVKAVNGIDGFMAFIRECMTRLDEDLADEKKDQEKNLPTT